MAEPVGAAPLDRLPDRRQPERLAGVDREMEVGVVDPIEGVEVARRRGCDLVFLVADEQDWPKTLYEKLGFEPVTTLHHFLKTNS